MARFRKIALIIFGFLAAKAKTPEKSIKVDLLYNYIKKHGYTSSKGALYNLLERVSKKSNTGIRKAETKGYYFISIPESNPLLLLEAEMLNQ